MVARNVATLMTLIIITKTRVFRGRASRSAAANGTSRLHARLKSLTLEGRLMSTRDTL